jgi:hypothetical protein
MLVHLVEQGSKQWFEKRLGIPTASKFDCLITPLGKVKDFISRNQETPSTARKYLYQLVAERLLGRPIETDLSNIPAVRRGRVLEPEAADILQDVLSVKLMPVGFITSNDGKIGCSPDRLIAGKNACVEIKCPHANTQLGYLLDGPGGAYRAQVQGQMYVGEFDKSIFFSWHPQTPMVCLEYGRDERFIRLLAQVLNDFCAEVDKETERARAMGEYIVRTDWVIND